MRRDYGGEILVAIGAISVLVFAIAFAVIVNVTQPTLTATAAVQRTTATEGFPTTVSVAASATAAPNVTATDRQSTRIAAAASATMRVPTETSAATATAEPSPTRLPASPSATRRPPTFTSSPTLRATSMPTRTPAPTATRALPSPSPAPTMTATPRPTLTQTPVPTATPIATVTLPLVPTFSPTSAGQIGPITTGCPPPIGWVPYVIRLGDTLFSLARRSGVTVRELRAANCLPDETIIALETLYLPDPAQLGAVDGCNALGVIIRQPFPNQRLQGTFDVRGTAAIENFAHYRLEIAASGSGAYQEVARSTQPVADGLLATVDASAFASGRYTLRLVVVDARGAFPQPCAIQVILN